MSTYNPNINTDAYSLEWLQTRAANLRRVLMGGTKAQRLSTAASAELAAINYGIRHRPVDARPVAVPVPPVARPVVTLPVGPYSQELHKANRDNAPKLHSIYA